LDFGTTSEPFATTLAVIGLPPELRDHLSSVLEAHATSPSRWVDAARRALAGDYLGAAEVYAAMPLRPIEADARLRAAEALIAEERREGAESQLEQALAFWRAVGATRYLRRAEQLRSRIVA
jgi:hypothetical protein